MQSVGVATAKTIHLCDVKRFGHLDKFSAFAFENYMQSIKTHIKGTRLPLEEVCWRLSETESIQLATRKYPKPTSGIVYKMIHYRINF